MYGKKQGGNTLALVVVCIGVIVLLVVFFALNYSQLFGGHKQVQNAIDAAALTAARDIGRIVISDPNFGRVSLVDDVPVGGDLNQRPIHGINTILGTIRLDLIIAGRLRNGTLVVLGKDDLQRAENAAKTLSSTILVALGKPPVAGFPAQAAVDKQGTAIDIQTNATISYDENSRRLGKGQRVGNLRIDVGELTPGSGDTNIPVPQPESLAQVDNTTSMVINGQRCYRPYVEVATDVLGVNVPVVFAAVGSSPKLVETQNFRPRGGVTHIPAVVRVEADERVNSVATNADHKFMSGTLVARACAQAGGARGTAPSGTMCISFPQGFPPNSPVNFRSVRTIMNASMLPAGGNINSSPTSRGGWRNRAGELWYKAVNGGVGPSGNGTLLQHPYRGRAADNPSISLAVSVYDWLRSMKLRPNVSAVVNALNTNIRTYYNTNLPGSGQTFSAVARNFDLIAPAWAGSSGDTRIANAFWQEYNNPFDDPRSDTHWGGGAIGSRETGRDVATLRIPLLDVPAHAQGIDQTGARERNANYWGYSAVIDTIPENALPVVMDGDGGVAAPGGGDPTLDFEIVDRALETNEVAVDNYKTAKKVYDEEAAKAKAAQDAHDAAQTEKDNLTAQKTAKEQQLSQMTDQTTAEAVALKAEIDALSAQITAQETKMAEELAKKTAAEKMMDWLRRILANCNYVSIVTVLMYQNIQALLGGGVQEISPDSEYDLAGNKFFPCTRRFTEDEVKQIDTILPTGQDPEAPTQNWALPLVDGRSALYIYKHGPAAPVIGRTPDGGSFLPAAVAQAPPVVAVPPNQNLMFLFNVVGDASVPTNTAGRGDIRMTALPNSPFASMATLRGQVHYQALKVLRTVAGGVPVTWMVVARDNGANGDGEYFANVGSNGYNVVPMNWCHVAAFGNNAPGTDADPCASLVSEWQVRCPDPSPPPGSCGIHQFLSADGTLVVQSIPCPPPPPPHG